MTHEPTYGMGPDVMALSMDAVEAAADPDGVNKKKEAIGSVNKGAMDGGSDGE